LGFIPGILAIKQVLLLHLAQQILSVDISCGSQSYICWIFWCCWYDRYVCSLQVRKVVLSPLPQ